MSDISIVIVNYKVKHFLKQCLYAIQKASSSLDVDVWVVDNDSQDGSEEMINQFFPEVNLVVNKLNVGFSKANNQALRKITSKYTLILNPDTVLSEDCLTMCYQEMESDDNIGMIGVRMIDGTGTYLPESKRGFPTPTSSFYKLSGLYKFFPESAYFNHYYLGHLSEFEKNEVEVLTGAFMFSRTEVLHQVDYFDEDYFMYGEDIDLSTKVIKAGYKLIYMPETSIIHFKGESTKRDSAAYVKHFYNAMLIFTSKHFKGSQASMFSMFLKFGVFVRGVLGFVNQVVFKRAAVFIDIFLAFICLELVTRLWAIYYFQNASYYDGTSIHYNNIVYALLWGGSLYLVGHYGRKFVMGKLISGILLGTSLVFILYALLGPEYNPSRIIILLGTILFGLATIIKQGIRNFLNTGKFFLKIRQSNKVLIVAQESEVNLIESKLSSTTEPKSYIGFVEASGAESVHSLGLLKDIIAIVKTYEIDEIIFSLTHSKMSEIMPLMTQLGNQVNIKLTGGEHLNIIGSNSKNLTGEVYMLELKYNIDTVESRRQKRMFDILIGSLSLLLFPLLKIRNRKITFSDILQVVFGRKTYVAYQKSDVDIENLPFLIDGIVTVGGELDSIMDNEVIIHNSNLHYAKDYKVSTDLSVVLSFYGWGK